MKPNNRIRKGKINMVNIIPKTNNPAIKVMKATPASNIGKSMPNIHHKKNAMPASNAIIIIVGINMGDRMNNTINIIGITTNNKNPNILNTVTNDIVIMLSIVNVTVGNIIKKNIPLTTVINMTIGVTTMNNTRIMKGANITKNDMIAFRSRLELIENIIIGIEIINDIIDIKLNEVKATPPIYKDI